MRLREVRMPPPVTLTGRDDWLDFRKKSWSPVEDRGGVMTPVHTYQNTYERCASAAGAPAGGLVVVEVIQCCSGPRTLWYSHSCNQPSQQGDIIKQQIQQSSKQTQQ